MKQQKQTNHKQETKLEKTSRYSNSSPALRKEIETYSVDILCENCNNICWFDIPRNVTQDEFFNKHKYCSICGCKHGR